MANVTLFRIFTEREKAIIMEHKIGEVITLPSGKKAEVVECNEVLSCRYCIFCPAPYFSCQNLICMQEKRSDHKNIIYKEIKEE